MCVCEGCRQTVSKSKISYGYFSITKSNNKMVRENNIAVSFFPDTSCGFPVWSPVIYCFCFLNTLLYAEMFPLLRGRLYQLRRADFKFLVIFEPTDLKSEAWKISIFFLKKNIAYMCQLKLLFITVTTIYVVLGLVSIIWLVYTG